MTVPDAIKLVLQATSKMEGGETFILKMPSTSLKNLFDAVVRIATKAGLKFDYDNLLYSHRTGEKLHEELILSEEADFAHDLGTLIKVDFSNEAREPLNPNEYSSGNQPLLAVDEVEKMIHETLDYYGMTYETIGNWQ